jgi:hypothetical protein
MSTYLTETFEAGPPLHAQVASPGYGQWDDPGWSSPYPISLAYYLNIVAGAGRSGGFGLQSIPGGDSWIIVQVWPPAPVGGPGASQPLADAGKGRVQFDIKLDPAIWGRAGGYVTPLFDLNDGYYDATYGLHLTLSNDPTGGGPLTWGLWYSYGNGTPNTQPVYRYYSDGSPAPSLSSPVAYASLVDGNFHRVEVTWQAGTVSSITLPPASHPHASLETIAADGWVKLVVDGVTVIDTRNIPLIFNAEGWYSDPAGVYHQDTAHVNRFTAVGFGDDWLWPGAYDNIIVGTPEVENWVPIADWHAQEYLNAADYPGGVARCVCKLWATAAGVAMKARLVSLLANGVTVDAEVGRSAEVTSQVPTDGTFGVTLTGNKMHRIELTSPTTRSGLWCSPDAKVLA